MPRNQAKAETARSAPKPAAAAMMMPEVDYQSLAMASGSTVQALMRASDAMLKGVMALSQEMTEFTNARLRLNVERSETLLRCHDPAEQPFVCRPIDPLGNGTVHVIRCHLWTALQRSARPIVSLG